MKKKYNVNCPLDDKDQILLNDNQTLEEAAYHAAGILAEQWLELEKQKGDYEQANYTLHVNLSEVTQE
jgi:hypothetical protein